MNPLTIYRKHPSAPDTYYIGGGWSPACITAVEKRFTDAELAAEFWAFDFQDFDRDLRADPDECSEEEWAEYIERRNEAEAALRRAATLPHYDENPA